MEAALTGSVRSRVLRHIGIRDQPHQINHLAPDEVLANYRLTPRRSATLRAALADALALR
jgi:hypothetical protein